MGRLIEGLVVQGYLSAGINLSGTILPALHFFKESSACDVGDRW
jgi:hypothetical protein